ncbi:MAG: hypothetical protein K6F69_00485, partial [Treponema sp.]|nr:hypothetical protein [Treponema sp.]
PQETKANPANAISIVLLISFFIKVLLVSFYYRILAFHNQVFFQDINSKIIDIFLKIFTVLEKFLNSITIQ